VHHQIVPAVPAQSFAGEGVTIMTKHICAACGALALAGVALGAQTPTPSQPPTTQPPASVQPIRGDNPVTVTGCLKPFDASTMGSRPSEETGAAAAEAKLFVLTKVGAGAGTTSSPAGRASESFILKAGASSVNLAQHVNHTVEVTGSKSDDPEKDRPSTPGTVRPGAPEPPATAAQHRDKPATLTVTALKMVAASCN